MQSRIADDLNRTDLTTQIKKAINRAIDFYEGERFAFNEAIATASTVASQEYYAEPTDCMEIDSLTITVSGRTYQLTRRDVHWFQDVYFSGTHTGLPTDFTTYDEQIRLYPIPNDVYTLKIYYQKSYSDLSADADTNDFITKAEDLIEARAKWWIYSRILKNQQMAAVEKAAEREALDNLRGDAAKRLSTGRIRPTQY